MIDYKNNFELLEQTPLRPWLKSVPSKVANSLNSGRWGDLPKWSDTIKRLPEIKPSFLDLNSDAVAIGRACDCDEDVREELKQRFLDLRPWRKGPFDVFGIPIDTEWRSDLKWNRLKNHITPLRDRLVLDIGCGSGYHCWRMAGSGATLVVGIDPTLLYVMQFQAMQKYINQASVSVYPLGIDDLPEDHNPFDTVFSMGLMYHRRAPFDHLLHCKSLLREGGELVLETLVIDGSMGEVLSPEGRYAKMPNVWFIPSSLTLESWIKRTGFSHVRCIDKTKTTSDEQRGTLWMGFESLADFLDPKDPNLTIEGYPAPQRAIFIANNQ